MKISIVVPAYNEEKLIQGSIRSIRRAARTFDETGWATELIVCDNNSTDRTAELACAEGARVVFEPVNQIARSRNCGARAAAGDWLVFVDADSEPSPELFRDMVEAIGSGRYLAGGSTLAMEHENSKWQVVVTLWNGISRFNRWFAGSFIFCQRAAFWEAGGFDQRFYAGEEVELARRLKKLARQKGQSLVILRKHPLQTSSRKLHLYSTGEHLVFLLRAVLQPKRTLQNAAACSNWYDGRR